MIAEQTLQTKACFDAWINCENLLVDIQAIKKFLSRQLVNVIDECAYITLGTFHALKSGSVNSKRMALLCVGICEECAELCEKNHGTSFQKCAATCRQCANTLSDLSLSNKN